MSSSNLISSLFRDNSFATRSSSLFNKPQANKCQHQLSISNSHLELDSIQGRSRSQSSHPRRTLSDDPACKYLPLMRMAHLLALKVKKYNYFLFCRLETQWKAAPKPLSKGNPDARKAGIEALLQNLQLIQLKRQDSTSLEYAITKIKAQANRKRQLLKLVNTIAKIHNQRLKLCLNCLQSNEKLSLRAEIFTGAVAHVIQPKLKNIFSLVREQAISNKIHQQINLRQQQLKSSQIVLAFVEPQCERLKSISEESSFLLDQSEEEETARFLTPERQSYKNARNPQYFLELQKSKTSRKELKLPASNQNSSKKQIEYTQFDQGGEFYILHSSRNRRQEHSSGPIKASPLKATISIRKQTVRHRIHIPKAAKVETNLNQEGVISLPQMEKQAPMAKVNKIYLESVDNPLPDLHDNMGVFESLWSETNSSFMLDSITHRTEDKNVDEPDLASSSSTKAKKNSALKYKKLEQTRTRIDQSNIYFNSEAVIREGDQQTATNFSKGLSKSISNARLGVEAGTNTSFEAPELQCEGVAQFYSSPLEKIEQMMMDLERLREREKYASKYSVQNYQKCKISVNLPSRKSSAADIKSYYGSASKFGSASSCRNNLFEPRSDKKQLRREAQRKSNYKQNNQLKENIQVRLWDEKNKFAFYADNKPSRPSREKKAKSSLVSMTHSQINTARKVKKEIETIINSRNRTSLGNLKLIRNKF